MKKDNKGFSLVELIIVIAIMAVLVGILAPQFIKYVDNSKISTDITNAEEIATTVNTLIADSKLAGTSVTLTTALAVPASAPASVSAANDANFIMYTLGKKIAPKYKTTASYEVAYSTSTGVTKILYDDGTKKYEVYPNPDSTDATNPGLNTLKK